MDGLAAASSVLAVIQVAGAIAKLCGSYIKDVKNAREDIIALQQALAGLTGVLEKLSELLQRPGSRLTVTSTLKQNVFSCHSSLKSLEANLDPGTGRKAMTKFGFRALKWPLKRPQVEQVMNDLDRYKSSFTLSLQIDEIEIITDMAQKATLIDHNLDLDKLPMVYGAEFDSYMNQHEDECFEGTRTELRAQIQEWAISSDGSDIFWLNGMAGTGKSTISRTVANSFKQTQLLGASFFFKRGEWDRGNATKLFTTIVRQLITNIPQLSPAVKKAIQNDPGIATRGLKEQFNRLLLEPLRSLKGSSNRSIKIIVIDALDECDSDNDIRTILYLLPQLHQVETIRVRVFLTSRPELAIRLGFSKMVKHEYQDLALHEIPEDVTAHDISLFLERRLAEIQAERCLPSDWPRDTEKQGLVKLSVPLFIFAATMCRLLDDPQWDPVDILNELLERRGEGSHLDGTYLPVLHRLIVNQSEKQKNQLIQEFQDVVGSIIILESPLAVPSLSKLLGVPEKLIKLRLASLSSVLRIPKCEAEPVRPFHLSFRDFLLDPDTQKKTPFWVEEKSAHRLIFHKCLDLCSKMQRNICGLLSDAIERAEIDASTISRCVPPELQYSCRFWAHHLAQAGELEARMRDAYAFLQEHFLHWLEVMGILGLATEALRMIELLESCTQIGEVLSFLYDARRFILRNRHIINTAPLQIYCSGLIFAPKNSIIRQCFKRQFPQWISRLPEVDENWRADLQTLEGHSEVIVCVALSPDGRTIASGSYDKTIKLWDIATGVLQQSLDGHTEPVMFLAFHPDGRFLLSVSSAVVIKIWNPITGGVQRTLESEGDASHAVLSGDGRFLATRAHPSFIILWDLSGDCSEHRLLSHPGLSRVAFSPDNCLLVAVSDDGTIELWDVAKKTVRQSFHFSSRNVISTSILFDGRNIAVCDTESVFLCDLDTGIERKLHNSPKIDYPVTFLSGGRLLMMVTEEGFLVLWDVMAGLLRQAHQGPFDFLGISPNSRYVALNMTGFYIALLDLDQGQLYLIGAHSDRVTAVAFSSDSQYLVSTSSDKTVRIWSVNAAVQQQKRRVCDRSAGISLLGFCDSGRLLTTCSRDGTLALWNSHTGALLQEVARERNSIVFPFSFSLDGQYLVCNQPNGELELWEISMGAIQRKDAFPLSKLGNDPLPIPLVTLSSKAGIMACSVSGKSVWLFDIREGLLQPKQKLKEDTEFVSDLRFSPDGSLLALCSNTKTVKLWNTATGALQDCLECKAFSFEPRFSPDGQLLAACLYQELSGKEVVTWDITSGRQLESRSFSGSSAHPQMLMFSRDGSHLNTEYGFLELPPDHRSPVADPSEEGVDIWILQDGWVTLDRKKALWLPPEYRHSCRFAVNGSTLAMGHSSGRVFFIDFAPKGLEK